MKKLRVGVLMGGKSIEREVSLNSGRTICDHLDTSKYDVTPIFQIAEGELFILPWHFLHRGKIVDFKHRLKTEAKRICWDDLKKLVDFIYLAIHGNYAEDGTVQGMLEIFNIPYLGSKVFGSALCMNKIIQKEFLSANGINIPKWITFYPNEIKNTQAHKTKIIEKLKNVGITLPCVVKPHKEGSSLGVEMVFVHEKLFSAMGKASKISPGRQQEVVIEECMDGMEFSCCIITDYRTGKLIPLPPTEIVKETGRHIYDYEQKYMPGRADEYTPARCSQEDTKKIQDTCLEVMNILNITNVGRIDGFLTKDGPVYIVDPNTLTGMGPASFFFREAAEHNINHTQLINHLIETELESYGLLLDIIKQEKKQVECMKSEKMRIAILMGGNTSEREISLESGRNITYKLSPQTYNTIPIFVSDNMELYKLNNKQLIRHSTREIESLLEPQDKIKWSDLPKIADFIFIGLHGGEGENGCIQGALEMLDLPYNGSSVLASALGMDKYKTNEFLGNKGFNVPKSILISMDEYRKQETKILEKICAKIEFPMIVKPHDDGCSILVNKVENKQELQLKIEAIFAERTHVMIEELIQGMELTVGIIGNEQPQALPPSQTVSSKGILSIEEKFLPGAGENQTPAPLPDKSIKLVKIEVEKIFKTLGCKGYARIDCFYQSARLSPTKKERLIFLEVNTLPAMTPATCLFHQAAEIGIKPMDFIDLIINLGLESHKQIKYKTIIPLAFKRTKKIKSQNTL